MKLRLKGSTLRIRLDGEDLGRLTNDQPVVEQLEIGDGESSWSYGIAGSSEVAQLTLRLNASGLAILLPRDVLRTWAASDEEGFYGDSDGVHVSIEKDRGCDHGS